MLVTSEGTPQHQGRRACQKTKEPEQTGEKQSFLPPCRFTWSAPRRCGADFRVGLLTSGHPPRKSSTVCPLLRLEVIPDVIKLTTKVDNLKFYLFLTGRGASVFQLVSIFISVLKFSFFSSLCSPGWPKIHDFPSWPFLC